VRVLITGNQGYIGPLVAKHFRAAFPQAFLIGLDAGYFADCWSVPASESFDAVDLQIRKDVRFVKEEDLRGIDSIVHLAAISNDPMGREFESVTYEVNFEATQRLAEKAKRARVKQFVFASSCSVYGLDNGEAKTESSLLSPLTAYAVSKCQSEGALKALASKEFQVTALRFATACGFSPRCRLDLVLNDFVASALVNRSITLLSDGTPWRPLIAVEDMARAFEWAIVREAGDAFLEVNVGSDEWNFTIGELAEHVAQTLGGMEVKRNPNASPDKRSYRVNFDRFRALAPDHQPQASLEGTVKKLASGLSALSSLTAQFRESPWVRLNVLNSLRRLGKLDSQLLWKGATL
jgi:nucleoside-diphosphate-sugar epimerase